MACAHPEWDAARTPRGSFRAASFLSGFDGRDVFARSRSSRLNRRRTHSYPHREKKPAFPRASDGQDVLQSTRYGVPMKLAAISTAVVSSLVLAALAFADASPTSNKWRIELSGQALTTGELVFRVTPSQGEATDVAVAVKSGRAENNVAKDVRDAFASQLSPQRFSIEVDDGEDVLVKKKDGQPDFALELVEASVQNVTVKVEGE